MIAATNIDSLLRLFGGCFCHFDNIEFKKTTIIC